MESANRSGFIEKLNCISAKVLMPTMFITFVIFNTVINMWIGERAETIQNVLAIIILAIVACNLLSAPKTHLLPWMKTNILVIAYLIVRLVSLWKSGFDYSVIRSIFFEMFYLIGICAFTISKSRNSIAYIKFFLWFEFIVTFLSLALYYGGSLLGEGLGRALDNYTYIDKSGNALMFSNPNTAGIMAAFGVVLAIVLYKKKTFNNKIIIAYGLYNIIALVLFGCRSADMGVVAVIVSIVIFKIFKKVDKRKFVVAVLLLAVVTLVPVYGLIYYHESKESLSYSSIEEKVNDISTGRYIIWKECAITQQKNILFGAGGLRIEKEARQDLFGGLSQNERYWKYVAASELGPHNGYIGMISATGLLGMGLFIAILIQRIKRAKHLVKGNWYLILIFIIVANCFESLFILNRFFTCFYMFLILEVDMDEELPEEATS